MTDTLESTNDKYPATNKNSIILETERWSPWHYHFFICATDEAIVTRAQQLPLAHSVKFSFLTPCLCPYDIKYGFHQIVFCQDKSLTQSSGYHPHSLLWYFCFANGTRWTGVDKHQITVTFGSSCGALLLFSCLWCALWTCRSKLEESVYMSHIELHQGKPQATVCVRVRVHACVVWCVWCVPSWHTVTVSYISVLIYAHRPSWNIGHRHQLSRVLSPKPFSSCFTFVPYSQWLPGGHFSIYSSISISSLSWCWVSEFIWWCLTYVSGAMWLIQTHCLLILFSASS